MAEPFIAQVVMFGGNFAPRSWAPCDGQLLSISGNSALFSIVGTIYGGNGTTSFGLPDLRGRMAVHSGNGSAGPGLSPYPLGQKSGSNQRTLTVANLPSHTHTATGTIHATNSAGGATSPVDGFLAEEPGGELTYSGAAGATGLGAGSLDVTVENSGGNQPIDIDMPFQAVNYLIALFGIYPSRA